jgi:uncharacterized protein (TIGR03382 family)
MASRARRSWSRRLWACASASRGVPGSFAASFAGAGLIFRRRRRVQGPRRCGLSLAGGIFGPIDSLGATGEPKLETRQISSPTSIITEHELTVDRAIQQGKSNKAIFARTEVAIKAQAACHPARIAANCNAAWAYRRAQATPTPYSFRSAGDERRRNGADRSCGLEGEGLAMIASLAGSGSGSRATSHRSAPPRADHSRSKAFADSRIPRIPETQNVLRPIPIRSRQLKTAPNASHGFAPIEMKIKLINSTA